MNDEKKPGTSRRAFVQLLAGGAVAAGAASALGSLSPTNSAEPTETRPKIQYGMLIDTRRCIGCHSCSVACKAEFDVPLGVNKSWVEYTEKGTYPNVKRHFLPRLCNHCSIPQCVAVCPTGATYKRPQDGIVVVDSGLCIGCKYCIQACPYDARFLNPVTQFADKCDFCVHRVSKGLLPSCVNTCIGGARIFGDVNDPESEISRLIATNAVTVLRANKGTEPNVYYIEADLTEQDENSDGSYKVRVTTHRSIKERK